MREHISIHMKYPVGINNIRFPYIYRQLRLYSHNFHIFIISGHFLRLSARLSPRSHNHIYILGSYLAGSAFSFLTTHISMWPLLRLSTQLSLNLTFSGGYPPGSALLSHACLIFLIYAFNNHIYIYTIHISMAIPHFTPYSINSFNHNPQLIILLISR